MAQMGMQALIFCNFCSRRGSGGNRMCGYRNSRAASLPLGCFPAACPAYGDAALHCPVSENRGIRFFALRIKKRVFL